MARALTLWTLKQAVFWLWCRKTPAESVSWIELPARSSASQAVRALKLAGVRPNSERRYEARAVRATFPPPGKGRPPNGAALSADTALTPHVRPEWSVTTLEDFGIPSDALPRVSTRRRQHYGYQDITRLAWLIWGSEPMPIGDLHVLYLQGKQVKEPGWSSGFPELYEHALLFLEQKPFQHYYNEELNEDEGTSLGAQRIHASNWRNARWVLKRNRDIKTLIKPKYS